MLLLLFRPGSGAVEIVAPTVTTAVASSISLTTLVANGEITATGGANATDRGFQYNTVPFPDKTKNTTGSFGTGTFNETLSGLTPGTDYFYRAFATNSAGTSFGDWQQVATIPATYNITIAGVDRTADVINRTLVIDDAINDKQNTCNFALIDRNDVGVPDTNDEIIITLDSGVKIFGGHVVSSEYGSVRSTGKLQIVVECIDFVWELDRNLVHRSYINTTDKAIFEDIVSRYAAGSGITTNNVIEGVTIDQISFNYVQPSQAFRRIADLTGRNWYLDYDKDLHYFPLTTETTPFNITDTTGSYSDLKIRKDGTQIKNRVYVRGGTKLSDFTEHIEVGDGEKIKFNLPDKPRSVTVEVDTGAGYSVQTVGIKNVDLTGFDWYLNFQEKYIEQDVGGSVLTSSHKLRITYKYDIPILVAQENQASITEHGVREFLVVDKSIKTTNAARDRAIAELTDYAAQIIEGSFNTFEPGFVSGQYININSTNYGVSADYIVQKVTARSMGGGLYRYSINLASAKTMGIVRFLIELLEANRNLVELDENEVVDELLTVTDSLLSDSLIDSLTLDSAGPYATWSTDSLQSSPTTRAIWGLFQWG